jgi:hypothetical protein
MASKREGASKSHRQPVEDDQRSRCTSSTRAEQTPLDASVDLHKDHNQGMLEDNHYPSGRCFCSVISLFRLEQRYKVGSVSEY